MSRGWVAKTCIEGGADFLWESHNRLQQYDDGSRCSKAVVVWPWRIRELI